MSYNLDTDHARQFVLPDLGPSCCFCFFAYAKGHFSHDVAQMRAKVLDFGLKWAKQVLVKQYYTDKTGAVLHTVYFPRTTR